MYFGSLVINHDGINTRLFPLTSCKYKQPTNNPHARKSGCRTMGALFYQPPVPKSNPRSRLEVFLKIVSLVFIRKGNGRHYLYRQPWFGVVDFTAKMPLEPLAKVGCTSGIVSAIRTF